MTKTIPRLILVLMMGWLALAACGSGGDTKDAGAVATLPAPQVRVELLPTATLQPEAETTQPETTATPTPASQVQAWPTLDEEQYLLDLIDGMIEKIERRLDNTDTELKP